MTKALPKQQTNQVALAPAQAATPTPSDGQLFTVDSPKEEQVFSKKLITVNGKTDPQATIIVSSEEVDQVIKPAANGDYTVSQTIPDGTTLLHITAIFPNGEEKTITRTVTYSSENF